MKKLFSLFAFMFVITAVVIGQTIDPPAVNDTPALNELLAWLKSLWTDQKATLFILLWAAFSEWLGNTGKVKEGSVYSWITNLIGKIIKKEFFATKKGKFMSDAQVRVAKLSKIIILAVILSGVGLSLSAQSRWSQFTKKTNGLEVSALAKADGDQSYSWFVKPAAQLTAMNLNIDPETRMITASPFSAAGIGIGYQHYLEQNGVLVNNFGVNGLLIINGAPENESAGFGAAATINALGFVNVGGGRDFTNKKWLILLGGSWSF